MIPLLFPDNPRGNPRRRRWDSTQEGLWGKRPVRFPAVLVQAALSIHKSFDIWCNSNSYTVAFILPLTEPWLWPLYQRALCGGSGGDGQQGELKLFFSQTFITN